MSRVIFKTGKPHQEHAAVWARQRLADRGGHSRTFSSSGDQDGVLFADGVGLGKTWEALAAAALILYKAGPERDRRHVLILCPANLVTKWEEELTSAAFRHRLDRWTSKLIKTGHAAAAQRVRDTLSHVLPIRSASHVRIRKKYGRFHPPGGTYIVSQTLFTKGGRGLTALKREPWDVVIIDEAHGAHASNAAKQLKAARRNGTRLLLSATPFQLQPRQWNQLAGHLLLRGQKILDRQEVRDYIDQVADIFADPTRPDPSRGTVKEASALLRKVATRTVPRASKRVYELLKADGSTVEMPARLDELDDGAVRQILADLSAGEVLPAAGFEAAYLERRFKLAAGGERTYVATELRRVLANGIGKHESPRRRALEVWAAQAFSEDIDQALRYGLPRKTIVFTSWVGDASHGEAQALKQVLTSAFRESMTAQRLAHKHDWGRWLARGQERLHEMAEAADAPGVAAALHALGRDELTCVVAGRHKRLASRLRQDLTDRASTIEAKRELAASLGRHTFEGRALRRQLADMKRRLSPWTAGRPLGAVERYTGDERRSERDRAATAFREIGPPWVLVASNVGSEGIDLHTYTARIVHYDLEWNPARMEQREGRGDRVGRKLRDKLQVVYCLVPRTYDERMFHQLVARDRWHGVLLGKPACRLETEESQAPLVDRKRLARIRLDLSPA